MPVGRHDSWGGVEILESNNERSETNGARGRLAGRVGSSKEGNGQQGQPLCACRVAFCKKRSRHNTERGERTES